MATLHRYRVYCETESTNVYVWDEMEPVVCPNNNEHIISTSSITIINSVSSMGVTTNSGLLKVKIQEESIETGEHFQCVCYKMICPTGVSSHIYSYPHPVSVLSITLTTSSDHTDDIIEVQVGSNTIVGILTSEVNIDDTVINVSQSVIDNVKVGFYAHLFNGTNTENLGKITSINTSTLTVTVENGSSQSFNSGSYFQITIKVIENFTIGLASRYELGKDKIGGSYIPSGTNVKVIYTNNGISSKNFYPLIEYLY